MSFSFDVINQSIYNQEKFEVSQPKLGQDIEVTSEYQQTLAHLRAPTTQIVFVTGGAGSGKSTLIKYIVSQTDIFGCVPVIAPTGIAALNVNGQTIHKFFKIPVIGDNEIYTSQALITLLEQQHDWSIFNKISLIIIDEVSMVRCDLLDAIDHVLKKITRRNELFGGIKVLLVGDLLQLPPISNHTTEMLLMDRGYRDKYFFNAKCLRGAISECVVLTKPFRQTESSFLALLNNIRFGRDLTTAVSEINRCYSNNETDIYSLSVTPTRALADTINLDNFNKLPGEETIFTAKTERDYVIQRLSNGEPDDTRLPAPFHLKLKDDAIVMFTKNDIDNRWVNGTIGKIRGEEIDGEIKVILVETPLGSGTIYRVNLEKWENCHYEYDQEKDEVKKISTGIYIQYPLQLAWAVTIHKCQGLTLDNINIEMGTRGAFANGQTYVALSRCTKIEGIKLTRPLTVADIKVSQEILKFYREIGAYPQ